MLISENVDLSALNTFKVAARARYFAVGAISAELTDALEFAAESKLPVCILGGGSNTLFVGDFPGLVLRVNLRARDADESSGEVVFGAGENWHDAVKHCLGRGFYGIENLALIPGAVGAAPIQNIGAYGVELSKFFYCLEALHRHSGKQRLFYADDCGFAYRHSVFKQADNPWIIMSVRLRLLTTPAPEYSYPALAESLVASGDSSDRGKNSKEVTPQRVFDTVCRLRRSKLPDPAERGNAGSFFKNPIVSKAQYEELKSRYRELPGYAVSQQDAQQGAQQGVQQGAPADGSSSHIKIPAGWLLEQLGWKGQRRGAAGVHDRHALVLVNQGGASGHDILNLAQEMQASVQDTFGISLQPEVCIVAGNKATA